MQEVETAVVEVERLLRFRGVFNFSLSKYETTLVETERPETVCLDIMLIVLKSWVVLRLLYWRN
jgi:hypothetical protein